MADVLTRVEKAFRTAFVLRSTPITLETVPDDIPDWDSLGHAALANSLEREFNIHLDVDELMAMENVREIVRIVESKIGNN